MKPENRIGFFLLLALCNPILDKHYCADFKKKILYTKFGKNENDFELPRLTFTEKYSFLQKFGTKLEGEDFEKYNAVMKEFSESDHFIRDLEQRLIKIRMMKTWDFILERGSFLQEKKEQMYSSYQITDEFKVIYS